MQGSKLSSIQRGPACPLCGNEAHQLIETISYDDIRLVYRKVLRIELALEKVQELSLLRCQDCDLIFFSPPVVGDPAFYEKLQQFPWYYLEDKAEYRIASRLIPACTSVLEVGCGAGVFSGFLPTGCTYKGIEYNSEAIRKARLRGLDVDSMSIETLAESPSNRFDVVCSFQVLEHVPASGAFLKASANLLRSGGTLIVAVPAEDSFMADEVNNVLNTPPHHLTRWTDLALQNIAHVTGLKLTHLEHEVVSDFNIPSLAAALLWRFVRQNLRIRVPMITPLASTFLARAALRIVSMPIELQVRRSKQRPAGHSVVAAYRKTST